MNTVAASDKSSVPKAAWVCLALAWVCFLVPIPGLGLFVGWPLNLVAFILAIVAMSRKGAMAGIIQLVASLIVSPIVYFVGLAILAGSLGAISDSMPKPRADTAPTSSIDAANETKAAQASQAAEITIDARSLQADYSANEIAADQKYKGKRLQVSGVVDSIASDIADEPVVVLEDGGFAGVHVEGLPTTVAANLAKGQTITVNCLGNGEMLGVPQLNECSLAP